ncbi:MAG: chemotaxis protein CheW [Clostridium sp.]
MQMVVFKLGNEHFAVETDKVQTIKEIMGITKVPKAPVHIKGLINLRGSIISLVDLNLLLNVAASEEQKNIIVLSVNNEEIGITVDEVEEVIDIEEKLLKKLDSTETQNYIKGIVNYNEKLLTIIDIDKLLY